MKKSKKILFGIFIAMGMLIAIFVFWFNYYHYFSPLYEPCNKKISVGMDFNEAKKILSVFDNREDFTVKVDENKLFYGDNIGVFCHVKVKDKKVIEVFFGREF